VSTDISGSVADRQRARTARGVSNQNGQPKVDPPRQRRPALAALALLLIVGGALAAGVTAVWMDSREAMLAVDRPLQPGDVITADHLREVPVASDGLHLVPASRIDEVVGSYVLRYYEADMLLDARSLDPDDPFVDGKVMVSVPLDNKRTPAGQIQAGDLVGMVRVGSSAPGRIGTGYILSVDTPRADDFSASASITANVLILDDVMVAVLSAVNDDELSLSLISRDHDRDVALQGATP
jgi:hypothetical protein